MAVYEMPQTSARWIKGKLGERFSPVEAERVYQRILRTYERFAREAPSIGGRKNPMSQNFYGALSAFAYYECMNRDMPPDEITTMCCEMTIMGRRGGQLSRLDLNNALVRRILHTLLGLRARRLNRHREDGSWNNSWGMRINPLHHKEGISVHLVGCPIADFAKRNGYGELIPYFCEADKAIIEHLGGTLHREHTVADGYEDCDYWIKNKSE